MINKRVLIIILFLFLGVFLHSYYAVFVVHDMSVYEENNFLENAQVFVLFLTFLVFLIGVYRKGHNKLIFGFFALLSLSFILREVDFEDLDIPAVLIFLSSGIGRNVLLTVGFLSLFSYACYHAKFYKSVFKSFFLSKTMVLVTTAGVFLIISSFFENADFPQHVYFEELIELLGYSVFLISSIVFFYELPNSCEQ